MEHSPLLNDFRRLFLPLGFPDSSASKESTCNMGDPGSIPGLGRDRLPTPVFLGFPRGSAGRESACNMGDLSSIPGSGRSPGERKGYPLQYPGLENSMDCIIHGVANSQTQLSDFRFYIQLTTFSNYIQRSPTTSYHSCCYHSYLGHDHLFPRLLIFC